MSRSVGMPKGCHNYTHVKQVPREIKKYWLNRHKIFSKYDQGLWLNDRAWYEVTPEPLADMIATHMAQLMDSSKTILIDVFAGVGGNTIAFAKSGRWDHVYAIEKDADTIRCGIHNSEVYGVSKKISWLKGDCFEVIKNRLASLASKAVIFASPPWGGPSYQASRVFNLTTMQPYTLADLHAAFLEYTKVFVLYLPRTSNLHQLAHYKKGPSSIPVVKYSIKGYPKALCAYFGEYKCEGVLAPPG